MRLTTKSRRLKSRSWRSLERRDKSRLNNLLKTKINWLKSSISLLVSS